MPETSCHNNQALLALTLKPSQNAATTRLSNYSRFQLE